MFVERANGLGITRRAIKFPAKQKMRRHQRSRDSHPDSVLEARAIIHHLLGQQHQPPHLIRPHRPTIGAGEKSAHKSLRRIAPQLGRHGVAKVNFLERRGGDASTGIGNGHGLRGNFFGGRKIFFHQQRRHREHIADVIKTITRIIRGKILGRLEVHSHQVANGIVVLRPIEAPHRHAPRIGWRGAVKRIQRMARPTGQ